MSCPNPEQLLDNLAGVSGASALALAKAHTQSCASCCATIDALLSPADPLVRLAERVVPETVGLCPGPEDLACWCAGDPLSPKEAEHISHHVSRCEACAFLAAQLRLEISAGSGHPSSGLLRYENGPVASAPVGSVTSGAPVVAQVVGALALVFLSAAIVLPRLSRMQFPRVPAMIDGTRQASNPAESPQQAIFEFRLRQSSEIHSFMFPHYPGVQLSGDYEFAVHLTALRPGWILLFSVNPDKRLTLLLPGDGGASQIPHLDAGQMVRFPSESAWEPITPNPGRRRFYAVYLDDVATARSLVAESRRADASEGGLAALRTKLDEMVVAGGCASSTRPCVLTFEYEVF